MRKFLLFIVCFFWALLIVSPSRAEESSYESGTAGAPPRWALDLSPGWTWIGHGRQTGGLTPTLAIWRAWYPSEALELAVGGDAAAFGFGAGSHWFALLTGPAARATWHPKPLRELGIGLGVRADVGRLPVCNAWRPAAACLNFWGFYPVGEATITYAARRNVSAMVSGNVRWIETFLWGGPSVNVSAGARISW